MARFHYRLLNVFAESPLAGNALCVFEDARGMSDTLMQDLALQFNLSETTFLLPSERANARVRIFAPRTEYPFAGHPTLGSAAVVAQLQQAKGALTLETQAGVILVTYAADIYRFKANSPVWKPVPASAGELAALLGIAQAEVGAPALWVNTGFEQLLIPLSSPRALNDLRLDHALAQRFINPMGLIKIYLWAQAQPGLVQARFFFTREPGVIGEDPGTGSACANLGGWFIATGARRPISLTVHQGDRLRRPCRLHLSVSDDDAIHVGGRVVEVGRGWVDL